MLSEKVTRPHVRAGRSMLIPCVPVSEGVELKFDRDVNSLVVCLGLSLSYLVVWVGSCLVVLVPTCPGFVFWGGKDAPMVLPLESCHHQCLWAICGVLGYPKGSAAELLDGSLKLRYCTTVFYQVIFPFVFLT